MKFCHPDIEPVFDTEIDKINTLVVENQRLLFNLLTDINAQLDGHDGRAIVSRDNTPLQTSKYLELLDRFVPFDINRKQLLSAAAARLEKIAVEDISFVKTMELLGALEEHLSTLAFELNCDIDFPKLSISSLIKASGISFRDDYPTLGEKLTDYFEAVTELERPKLFITLNLRSFISDEETELLLDTVIGNGYNMIMIESSERARLKKEKRHVIDADLCAIY
ncbi:MAG: type II-A CRISPR-associated protein Csn2 [Clostridiales bacterium]|nr:type II-A CRISPR-associated protein Csn2 [Clostridiales bacterium]